MDLQLWRITVIMSAKFLFKIAISKIDNPHMLSFFWIVAELLLES
jgi:hypothetical protein